MKENIEHCKLHKSLFTYHRRSHIIEYFHNCINKHRRKPRPILSISLQVFCAVMKMEAAVDVGTDDDK